MENFWRSLFIIWTTICDHHLHAAIGGINTYRHHHYRLTIVQVNNVIFVKWLLQVNYDISDPSPLILPHSFWSPSQTTFALLVGAISIHAQCMSIESPLYLLLDFAQEFFSANFYCDFTYSSIDATLKRGKRRRRRST